MTRLRRLAFAVLLVLLGVAAVARPVAAAPADFAAGSLIIPMDIDYQDAGMLQAFGLLDRLLRADIPIYWCIKANKVVVDTAAGRFQDDFTAVARDFRTSAAIPSRGYRGGPFVIAAADAARAAPVITAWQVGHATTTVHVATAPFAATVSRFLTAAPRIAVLADGNQKIAYSYLNAAAIPDGSGNVWTDNSPDVINVAQLIGPSTSNPADGALFRPSGQPAFCEIMTMHWNVNTAELPQATAEFNSFLQFPVHFNAECQAVNAVEGSPPAGGRQKFVAPQGFVWPAPDQPRSVQFSSSFLPFAQMDGPFGTIGGSEPAYALPAGTSYYDTGIVMVRAAGQPLGVQDIWMTGYAGGTCAITDGGICLNIGAKGKVSYLGGHQYDVKTPISRNPKSQGARLFLNSLYEAGCVTEEGQPVMRLVKSAPGRVTNPLLTYTIDWSNNGPGPGLSVQITDTIPAGTTFVSATGGGTFSGGVVTWNVGDAASEGRGTVTVTVRLGAFGTFTNQAGGAYTVGHNRKTFSSNPVTTVYAMAGCLGDAQCSGATPRCDIPTGRCVGCLSAADCSGTRPVCDATSHSCRACAGDGECGGTTPACQPSGACAQCSASNTTRCVGGTPLCNTTVGQCVACLGDLDCSGTTPVCDRTSFVCRRCAADSECRGATPACLSSGACGECSGTNGTQCVPPRGVCDVSVSRCVGCLRDGDCGGATPRCDVASKTCVGCLDGSDCGGATPLCDPGSHRCVACAGDGAPSCPDPTRPACHRGGILAGACSECSATNATRCGGARPICLVDTGTCGCTDSDGDSECGGPTSGRVCSSGAGLCIAGCSTAPGRNGCPSGQSCSDQTGAVGSCVIGCLRDGDCVTPPLVKCDVGRTPPRCVECLGNGDCPSPMVCDATAKRCQECTSADASNCSAGGDGRLCLASGTCGCASDADCGDAASGRVCGSAQRCVEGCRAAGGNGCPAGMVCDTSGGDPGRCVAATEDLAFGDEDAGTGDEDLYQGEEDQGGAVADLRRAGDLRAAGDLRRAADLRRPSTGDAGNGPVEEDAGDNGDGGGIAIGGGCACAVAGARATTTPDPRTSAPSALVALALAALALRRRRR